MKSFVEKTRARMGDLQSQVTSGVTRVRSQLSRSNEDLGSEVGTPIASGIGSLDNLPPEEAIAKLEAQNQALWTKLQAATRIQRDNTMLQAELVSAKNKLVKVSDDADEQIQRVQESNEALKTRLREVMEELEQLRAATQDTQNNPGPSGAPVVHDVDSKSGLCKAPDPDMLEQILVWKNHSGSMEDRCSELETQLSEWYKRVEELENEKSHAVNESKLMGEEMRKCQKELAEAGEAQSYLTSVVEDLQNQLDACSPDQVVYLRGMVQRLEADNSQLNADIEVLSLQLRSTSSRSCNVESKPACTDTFDEASYKDELDGTEDYDDEGGLISGCEISEKLVDLSEDIVTEMANVGTHAKVELVMSAVQYAGLLSVVQKAMKQMESMKSRSDSQQDTFALLDQTLSRSLSITNSRAITPCSPIDERIESVDNLIEEKQKEVVDMLEIVSKLKEQVKGQKCLSLPQEVQLEYLTQQLSSPVEGLRKGIEESKREVEALREQSEQQQQELTIQWQSKQQVLAETQAHHHQFSSVSQQIEHLKQANESIQTEKTDLEKELAEAREEVQELHSIVEELHGEIEDSDYGHSSEDAENHEHEISEPLIISKSQNGELLSYRTKMEAEVIGLEADLELSKSFGRKLEEQVRKLQAAIHSTSRSFNEEKLSKEVAFLEEKLLATEEVAAAEISSLQEVQVSLQGQLQRCKSHIAELTNKLQETEMITARHETLLRVEKESHEHTREHLAQLRRASPTDNSQSLPPGSDAGSEAGDILVELRAERDALFAELEAWKFKATDLGDQAELVTTMKQESEQILEQLSLKEAMWESERRKSDGLAAEKTKVQQELSSMQLVAGRLEDNLEKAKAEIVRLNEVLESERQQYTAATRSWEEELESLADSNLSRDSWPAAVRRLVEHCEQISVTGIESVEQAKRVDLEEQIEDALDRLEAVETDSDRKIAEIEAEKAVTEQKLSHLEQEMRKRESKLQEQLSFIEASASSEKARLETGLATMTKDLATVRDDAKALSQKLSMALDDKSTQLIELQEKTRTMMVEKDKEIEQLKSLGHGSEGSGSQTVPVGSGHVSEAENRAVALVTMLQNAAEHINDQVEGRDHSITFDPPKDVSRESSGNQDPVHFDEEQGTHSEKALELQLEAARIRVVKLEMEMLDSERTHALRDKACDILKEEIAELRRAGNRDGVDVNYLKNILVSAFEKGTLPKDSPMVAVLARLLHFSPKEVQRIEGSTPVHTRSSSRGLFPGWGR